MIGGKSRPATGTSSAAAVVAEAPVAAADAADSAWAERDADVNVKDCDGDECGDDDGALLVLAHRAADSSNVTPR